MRRTAHDPTDWAGECHDKENPAPVGSPAPESCDADDQSDAGLELIERLFSSDPLQVVSILGFLAEEDEEDEKPPEAAARCEDATHRILIKKIRDP